MKVTRDVVTDLLPLYLSGDASDDTRRLVDDFMTTDPEFAQVARGMSDAALKHDKLPPISPEIELQTIKKTKRLVRLRDAFFWISVFVTTTPFAVWDTSWGSGFLIRDWPRLAVGLGVLAITSWCIYFALKRRLSSTGL